MENAVHRDGTVGKALDVLDCVAAFDRPVRFSDILARSSFPKATVYRLLQTLTHQGMLAFDTDAQTYAPGLRLVRLAHTAWQRTSLAPVAERTLDALSHEVTETLHLAQLDGGQVLYVDKRNARVPVEMFAQAGKIGPAYCTGVGKAMLAFQDVETRERLIAQQSFHRYRPNTLTDAKTLHAELEAIRQRGHAFDNEEHEAGIFCVAIPILSGSGRVIGGLSVTSTPDRHDLDSLSKHLPALHAAAGQIAEDAQTWRFPEKQPASEKRVTPCQD